MHTTKANGRSEGLGLGGLCGQGIGFPPPPNRTLFLGVWAGGLPTICWHHAWDFHGGVTVFTAVTLHV